MPRVPLSALIAATALMFLGITLGSFIPTLLVGRHSTEHLTHAVGGHLGNNLVSRAIGASQVLLSAAASLAAHQDHFPEPENSMRAFLSTIVSSEGIIDYIHLASFDGKYVAMKLGEQGEPWQYNVRNSTYPCRTDFNLVVNETSLEAHTTNVLETFCGYEPMEELWAINANKTVGNGVTVSTVLPQFGVRHPPSSLSFGMQLKDPHGVPFAVAAVEFSLDEISHVMQGINYDGDSGAVLWDVRNEQYLAGTWLTNERENNPLYNTSLYDMNQINPTVEYRYLSSATPVGHALNHPLLVKCLGGGGAKLRTKDVVSEQYGFDVETGEVECFVQDLTNPLAAGLHIRILVFIDKQFYMQGISGAQTSIIIAITITFFAIAVIQGGVLVEMTWSIKQMGKTVHQTLTQANKRKKGAGQTRTSAIAEIAEMQDKLEHFGNAMNQYVPGEVVAELLLSGSSAEVFMTPTMVTVLFVDIESFTPLCESISPEDLSDLLLHYYDVQCGTLNTHGGVVDKYIGDCIMCTWGAPRQVDCPEIRAICAALHLRDNMKSAESVTFLKELGLKQLLVRVGLAKGEVLAGNMGSSTRLAYTVLGDTVNLASRLEAANKKFGGRIMVNEALFASTTDTEGRSCFAFRDIGTVQVYGKNQGERVYQILGYDPGAEGAPHSEHAGKPFEETPVFAFHSCTSSHTSTSKYAPSAPPSSRHAWGEQIQGDDAPTSIRSSHLHSSHMHSECSKSRHSHSRGSSSHQSIHLTEQERKAAEELRRAATGDVWTIATVMEIAKEKFKVNRKLLTGCEKFNAAVNRILMAPTRLPEAAELLSDAKEVFGEQDKLCAMVTKRLEEYRDSYSSSKAAQWSSNGSLKSSSMAGGSFVMFQLDSK